MGNGNKVTGGINHENVFYEYDATYWYSYSPGIMNPPDKAEPPEDDFEVEIHQIVPMPLDDELPDVTQAIEEDIYANNINRGRV